jgi:hypothetical protein
MRRDITLPIAEFFNDKGYYSSITELYNYKGHNSSIAALYYDRGYNSSTAALHSTLTRGITVLCSYKQCMTLLLTEYGSTVRISPCLTEKFLQPSSPRSSTSKVKSRTPFCL